MLIGLRDPSWVSELSAVVDASEKHTEEADGDGVLDGISCFLSLVRVRPRRKLVWSDSVLQATDSDFCAKSEVAWKSIMKDAGIHDT